MYLWYSVSFANLLANIEVVDKVTRSRNSEEGDLNFHHHRSLKAHVTK